MTDSPSPRPWGGRKPLSGPGIELHDARGHPVGIVWRNEDAVAICAAVNGEVRDD